MKRLCFVVLSLGALILGASPVLAHGDRHASGVDWTVGWAVEPAFAGQPNAVQLFLERGGSPLEGAQDDLRVEVSLGEASTEPLDLRTVFNSPGEYRADIIPTRPGDYAFRFTGTIEGESVDESWTASEDGFHEVTEPAAISFPDQAPTTSQLAERVTAAEESAGDSGLPMVLSVVALVLAAVVGALMAVNLRSAKR